MAAGSIVSAHEPVPRRPAAAVNADMASRATAWLDSLDDQQRQAASFPFDSDERLNWHFIPRERLGLPIKQMSLTQRRLAYGLLRSGLSHKGYLKDRTVNGTFASVASARRSPTALLRPSGGRGIDGMSLQKPKKRS